MAQSHASHPRPHDLDPFASSFDRLAVLGTLPPGWDTYDAEPITDIAIQKARAFLGALMTRSAQAVPSFIAPLPYGGVQLEWRHREREIELEIAPDGALAYLLSEGTGADRTFLEHDDATVEDAVALIAQTFADA